MALEDLEEFFESVKGAAEGLSSPLQDVVGLVESLSAAQRDLAAAQHIAEATGASLGQVQKALADQTRAANEATKARAKAAADAAKAEAAARTQAIESIAHAGDVARASLDAVAGKIRGLASAAGSGGEMSAVASAIGGVASKAKEAVSGAVDKLGDQLAKLGPEGEAAAAALKLSGAALGALLDIGAGVVGVFGALADVAIAVNGTLAITRDRFAALAGGAAAGAAVQRMLAGLNLPFAKAQVDSWAQSLLAAGIKGKQLEADIKAVAAATALMGESGGAAAESLFKRLGEGGPAADKLLKEIQTGGRRADKMLKEMGLSLADLGGKAAVAKMNADQLHEAIAKAMAKKGAGPLADLGLTFPVLIQKVKEGLFSLFDGLGPDVKKFMTAVKELFAQFSKGGGVINGLKPTVTSLMQGFFSVATSAVKAALAIVKFFQTPTGAFVLKAILYVIGTIAVGLIGILTLLSIPVVVLGAALAFVAAIIGSVIGAIVALVAAVIYAAVWIGGQLVDALSAVWDALSEWASQAASAGSDFVAGLVDGISSGVGAVVDAVKGLASSAMSAFTSFFGIKSPSTKMREHGQKNIAEEGLGEGMNRGAKKVRAAARRLGEAADPSGAGGKGEGDEGSGGPRFVFNNCNFGGSTQGTIERMMAVAYEKLAGEAGAQREDT